MASDLAAFGIADPAAHRLASQSTDYPVLPENWEALNLFLECTTQWRRAGLEAVITGLDYGALETVMRMKGAKNRKRLFEQVRLIEGGALQALREQRD
ncbi:MAG: DUF1799 domain-containing protein [Marinobacter sp.]|uniref:DUF1799 domain-containing protein n=1 Tax=Marinobacter sp. TaxID=50741 RepID=UPI00299D9553|nr:DUF1799 domain-containing protein [Marinobacter sp.]MDX1755888.1 DUF1799 domain-containing protein [Marinobacter sp.]